MRSHLYHLAYLPYDVNPSRRTVASLCRAGRITRASLARLE
ncbi:hypothetical protein ppKF707_0800 [Metapseudomonas furukawaii]|uniref:Uncharacterized protein n=1 Tax=Metapseudomonas furukawaii TaxID=1149133 RepID=A0AAD1FHC0_METFU|nr:hypothetical protein ppKF707_0800 [Pseudomonas furukawaii]BAU76107.1 hypothetical protein KF707C_44190 [Pseudomonas furukawaii]